MGKYNKHRNRFRGTDSVAAPIIDSWALGTGQVSWEELSQSYLASKTEFEDMGKKKHKGSDKKLDKVRKALQTGPKKGKCCQDRPRCMKCPTVIHRLRKQDAIKLDDEALKVALVKARRW